MRNGKWPRELLTRCSQDARRLRHGHDRLPRTALCKAIGMDLLAGRAGGQARIARAGPSPLPRRRSWPGGRHQPARAPLARDARFIGRKELGMMNPRPSWLTRGAACAWTGDALSRRASRSARSWARGLDVFHQEPLAPTTRFSRCRTGSAPAQCRADSGGHPDGLLRAVETWSTSSGQAPRCGRRPGPLAVRPEGTACLRAPPRPDPARHAVTKFVARESHPGG